MLSSALPPSIIVGRTVSSYFIGDIQNNQETITYTVYNEQATAETGVLLTDTLEPNITIDSASQQPDQSGQNVAWSLGTIQGYDRASVTLTINLPSNVPSQLDTGPAAYATLNGGAVSTAISAITLSPGTVDPTLLDATPDTDATDMSDTQSGPIADPYIQEEAAALDYNPRNIFSFLQDDISYNSYTGSLRGARGTLWSDAGNSLDVASLGVALMRASGIPAQYVSGTLSQADARQLILSMFPTSYQTVGNIPAGTTTSDPADDPELLSETESHYWFQFNTGGGMTDADPLMPGATIGQSFASATGTFAEVPDSLRATTEVSLTAEIYSQADAAFAFGSPFTDPTVLDHTFNDVNLVGHPLTVANFVSQNGLGALFTEVTNTYTPYIRVGDDASPDPSNDQLIEGTTYQEVLTSFPLGNQILTGLFMNIKEVGADGTVTSYQRTLADRIGEAGRVSGTTSTPISVEPTDPPLISPLDLTTVDLSEGSVPSYVATSYQGELNTLENELANTQAALEQTSGIPPTGAMASAATALTQNIFMVIERSRLASYLAASDEYSNLLASRTDVVAYVESPRISLIQSTAALDSSNTLTLSLDVDLLNDAIHVVAAPGQNLSAAIAFQVQRGFLDTGFETAILETDASPGPNTEIYTSVSAETVFELAQEQSIPLQVLMPGDAGELNALSLPANADAYISAALAEGQIIVVPSQTVLINGQQRVGWYQMNPTTGQTIGVMDNGSHDAASEEAAALRLQVALTNIAAFGFGVLSGLTVTNLFGDIKELLITTGIGKILGEKPKALAEIGFALLTVSETLKQFSEADPTLALFYAGVLAGIAIGKKNLLMDPDAPDILVSPDGSELPLSNTSSGSETVSATLSPNSTTGSVDTSAISVSGATAALWSSSGTSTFSVTSLTASSATLLGTGLGTGSVSLTSTGTSISAGIFGSADYQISGAGSLSFYGPAESDLGVSADWTNYSATESGSVLITVTVPDGVLSFNGTALPAGVYTIDTSAAALFGSGETASPNFDGSASVTATSGTLNLGPGTGTLTVGGDAVDPTNGVGLDGYTGNLGVSANGDDTDSVTLSGTSTNVLNVAVTPTTFTTDQNTPITFTPTINTSLGDTYDLTATAPDGWTLSIDSSGDVTATPAAGVQSGTYPIQIVTQSTTDPNLVAQTTVNVSINPTQPGINLTVNPDPFFTVPFDGAELPTAFQVSIQNLGPTADTYSLGDFDVPSGFTAVFSEPSVTVPAGQTGIVGVYLTPEAGSSIPAPNTQLSFFVSATSTTDSSITQTQFVPFTIPEIDSVAITSPVTSVATVPGGSTTDTITLANDGNVPETVDLSSTSSTDLTVSGLSTANLAVGQTISETITVSADPSTTLGSTRDATITATYDASDDTQTLDIPVNIAVPGADAIANAAQAAQAAGDTALGDRLNDLSIALTNLVQDPYSSVYDGQAVAALNAAIGLMGTDPVLTSVAGALTTDATTLGQVTDPASASSAATQLGSDLDTLGQILTDETNFKFTLLIPDGTVIAQPQTPETYTIDLTNTGPISATYNLTVSGVPSGVTASFSQTSVALDSGQESGTGRLSPLTLTLTSTSTTQLQQFDFTVTAAAAEAPEITQSADGSFGVRNQLFKVVSVPPFPSFTSPGGRVDVEPDILAEVNQTTTIELSYTVSDPNGNVVFTSGSTSYNVSLQQSYYYPNLETFNTTGFAEGNYTITVSIADSTGTPIPGATGTGTVLIGTPVSATLTNGNAELLVGNGVSTSTLQINAQTTLATPLTPQGQLAIAGAQGIATDGSLAYVGETGGIDIVNISNPAQTTVVSTFGSSDLDGGSVEQVTVNNNELVVLVSPAGANATPNGPAFFLLIYSLANPSSPTLLGQTQLTFNGTDPQVITGFTIQNNHVYTSAGWYMYALFGGNIFAQFGESLDVDISNPASPAVVNAIYNDPPSPSTVYFGGRTGYTDGTSFIDQIAAVNSNTLLMGSTTATMGDAAGSDVEGLVMVVDTTDPSNPNVVEKLQIPGMALVTGIYVEGTQAFVIGSQEGLQPYLAGPGGNVVVATLNLTNPQSPVITSTQTLAVPANGITSLTYLGNNEFITNYNENTKNDSSNPQLLLLDASDPQNVVAAPVYVPDVANGLLVSGGLLYTTDGSNLTAYSITTGTTIPVTAQITIPADGVSVDPTSFSLAPTSTTMNADGSKTIVWYLGFSHNITSQTITFNEDITSLASGETRPVVSGGTVSFISAGTAGQVTLDPLNVTGDVGLYSIYPSSQGDPAGDAAEYYINISNPTQNTVTYALSVQGLPASWVNFSNGDSLTIPSLQGNNVGFYVTPDTFAPAGTYSFAVTATGSDGSVQTAIATLLLEAGGTPPTPNPDSHGIDIEISPDIADIGQGDSGVYTIQLTNTGSADDTFNLTDALPTGVTGTFSRGSIDVPAGASNFRDVTLTLTPQPGTSTGVQFFTVTATSTTDPSVSTSKAWGVDILSTGVTLSLTPSSNAPGDPFSLLVTNTGGASDTFDLALTGPAAVVSNLGSSAVTLGAGASQAIPITTTAVDFAVSGPLELDATATSETNNTTQAEASADLTIPTSSGMTAAFTPDSQTLPTPGTATFTLDVNNTGNQQDSYEATITGTTGPVTGSLEDLNGNPTQTVPIFYLPGLSTGVFSLDTNLTGVGPGTVTVQITSLSDGSIVADATATVSASTAASAPTVTLNAPANDSTGNNPSPTFSGTASTDSGDLPTITVNIYSGSTATGTAVQTLTTSESNGTYSVAASPSLADGIYTAVASQSDSSETTGTSSANTFTIDTVAPTVTLTTPVNGSSTNNTAPTFSGAAGTATGDLATITVKIYSGSTATGTPVQILTTTQSNGSYSVAASPSLADGTFTAVASQSDSAGNTGTSSAHTFTIDTVAPTVTLTTPANGSSTNNTTPTFSGAAGTASGDLTTITIKIYSGSTATGTPVQTLTTAAMTGSYSVAVSPALANGTFTAVASQSDSSGNTGQSTANTFTINTVAPTVTLTTPANSSSTNNTTPTFGGTASTAAGDLPTITIKIYSGSTATGTPVQTLTTTATAGSYSASASPALANGTYTAIASQSDNNGNTGTSSANTFTIDTIAPTVTLTAPVNGSSTNTTTPTFSGAAGTATGDLTTITIKIYSGSTATGTPVQTLTTTATAGSYSVSASPALANGTFTAAASQSDAAGNTGHSTANTFTIDTVAPAVTLTSPANGSTSSNTSPTFIGAASTAAGALPTITIKIYSGSIATGTPVQTLTTTATAGGYSVPVSTPLGAGMYTAVASQSDSSGDTGTSSANTFTIAAGVVQLTGTPSANTTGSYMNLGNTYLNTFDGNVNTFFDAPTANGNYVQLDLGTPQTIVQIAFAPRVLFESRMNGGMFEASNDPNFAAANVVLLYQINSAPADGLTTVNVYANVAGTYRYVRYIAPNGSFGNIAEMQIFGPSATAAPLPSNVQLTGTPSANTAGSYDNDGDTYLNAFDGNTLTFFDAPTGNGNYVQLDLGAPQTLTQLAFAPRVGFLDRMLGGVFEASNDSTFNTGVTVLYTVNTQPQPGLTTIALSLTGTYRYIRYISPAGSYGNIAEMELFGPANGSTGGTGSGTTTQLTGTPSANTTSSYDGKTSDNYTAVFDGNTNTYFDAPTASGNYVELDLGAPQNISQIAFAPRVGFEYRMVGGYFEASNDPTFAAANTVTLYTILSTPPDGLTTISTNATGDYRYVRYVSPNGSYGNIAEMQLFGPTTTTPLSKQLTGTASGTTGSYENDGDTFANVFDGNSNTFFDAPSAGTSANPNYVQLDLGSQKTITQIAFAPRAGFEYRMIGGYFEVSNTANFSSGVTVLYTITNTPPDGLNTVSVNVTGPYEFVRYVAPPGSYGNIAEMQVFGY
jgi:uncharacterized membrane protein